MSGSFGIEIENLNGEKLQDIKELLQNIKKVSGI